MISFSRSRVLLVVLAILLVGAGIIVWMAAGLPPLRFYFRYGLTPYSEPTGEKTTLEGVEFVEIGPGIARVGSDALKSRRGWFWEMCSALGLSWGRQPRRTEEMPVHWVEYSSAFWIARTEITNEQYERFRSDHVRGEYSQGDRQPVTNVSWVDATEYCAWLSMRSGLSIRLPSEAEWECAARAGSLSEYCFGNDADLLPKYAWCSRNMGHNLHPVATRLPNGWGLYDFHGNATEWCADAWHRSYERAPKNGVAWTEPGCITRVVRGIREFHHLVDARSAARSSQVQGSRGDWLGFRAAFSNPE